MIIWIFAAAIYVIFLVWYYNWSGPMKAKDIEALVDKLANSGGAQDTDLEVVRTFLEGDDGKEFVMQNFVDLHSGRIEHPVSGKEVSPIKVIGEYTGPFIKELLKRGGHPVVQSRRIGGPIDSWGVDEESIWNLTSLMRYRSRRDLVEIVCDPKFSNIHAFKVAAIRRTASFPTQRLISFYMTPGIFVPMILVLLALLAQNVTALYL